MSETQNDVREQLAEVLHRAYSDVTKGSPLSGAIKYPVVDAILARFDVVEKPVVTASQGLGVPVELRALSAAMAELFGDAPDSWLLDAEDVVEHLQADGYRIVRADRLERLERVGCAARKHERAVRKAYPVVVHVGTEFVDAVRAMHGDDVPGDLDPVGTGGEGR